MYIFKLLSVIINCHFLGWTAIKLHPAESIYNMSMQRKSSDDEKRAKGQKKAVTLEQGLVVTLVGAGGRWKAFVSSASAGGQF
jgi:hypothetical protein